MKFIVPELYLFHVIGYNFRLRAVRKVVVWYMTLSIKKRYIFPCNFQSNGAVGSHVQKTKWKVARVLRKHLSDTIKAFDLDVRGVTRVISWTVAIFKVMRHTRFMARQSHTRDADRPLQLHFLWPASPARPSRRRFNHQERTMRETFTVFNSIWLYESYLLF